MFRLVRSGCVGFVLLCALPRAASAQEAPARGASPVAAGSRRAAESAGAEPAPSPPPVERSGKRTVLLFSGEKYRGVVEQEVPGSHVVLRLATGETKRIEALDVVRVPPPGQAAVSTSGEDASMERAVTLTNGTTLRGELVEYVPHDHLTLLLPSGEVRRIEQAEIQQLLPLGTPPAAPAAAAPSLRPASPPQIQTRPLNESLRANARIPMSGHWMSLTLSGGVVALVGVGMVPTTTIFGLVGSRSAWLSFGIPTALTLVGGSTMFGIGLGLGRRYQREMQAALRDPARSAAVLPRLRASMEYDRRGTLVTGALLGSGALLTAIGWGAFSVSQRIGSYAVAVTGTGLTAICLFPFIGFASSYGKERALLSHRDAGGAPARVAVVPILGMGTYGLSVAGGF